MWTDGRFVRQGFVIWGGSSGLEQDAKEREKMLLELRKYMEKDTNEIKKTFGKPADIESPSWYKKNRYDELWHYKIEKGVPMLFPNQYFIRFYFVNGKVAEIEVN